MKQSKPPCSALRSEAWLIQKYNEIAKSQERPYSLVCANIKQFRNLYTLHGKVKSDQMLQDVLQCLADFIKDTGYVSYSYADNFTLLLKMSPKDVGYQFFPAFVDEVFEIDNPYLFHNIYMSFGVYEISSDTAEYYQALAYANVGRLSAPTIRNRSFCCEVFSQEFYDAFMNPYLMEERVSRAYQNKEFVVYLQPKVRLQDQKVIGAEALIRWFDEDGQMIPLSTFLPILNQNNYIRMLDIQTFEICCQLIAERLKNGKPMVPISFNISQSFFYDTEMMRDYMEVYNRYQVPREYIQFELMESISLNDTQQLVNVIDDFKKEGFTCLLDDFGNGYSSFGVLINSKLDILKMDRQFFVEPLTEKTGNIIKTVVELAKQLHLEVIAEGVETQEYVDFLKEVGCDVIQGFYFYRPMPITELLTLLDKEKGQ